MDRAFRIRESATELFNLLLPTCQDSIHMLRMQNSDPNSLVPIGSITRVGFASTSPGTATATQLWINDMAARQPKLLEPPNKSNIAKSDSGYGGGFNSSSTGSRGTVISAAHSLEEMMERARIAAEEEEEEKARVEKLRASRYFDDRGKEEAWRQQSKVSRSRHGSDVGYMPPHSNGNLLTKNVGVATSVSDYHASSASDGETDLLDLGTFGGLGACSSGREGKNHITTMSNKYGVGDDLLCMEDSLLNVGAPSNFGEVDFLSASSPTGIVRGNDISTSGTNSLYAGDNGSNLKRSVMSSSIVKSSAFSALDELASGNKGMMPMQKKKSDAVLRDMPLYTPSGPPPPLPPMQIVPGGEYSARGNVSSFTGRVSPLAAAPACPPPLPPQEIAGFDRNRSTIQTMDGANGMIMAAYREQQETFERLHMQQQMIPPGGISGGRGASSSSQNEMLLEMQRQQENMMQMMNKMMLSYGSTAQNCEQQTDNNVSRQLSDQGAFAGSATDLQACHNKSIFSETCADNPATRKKGLDSVNPRALMIDQPAITGLSHTNMMGGIMGSGVGTSLVDPPDYQHGHPGSGPSYWQ